MKTINKIFAIALAALPVFASCTEEKIEVGGPENDSYGVYFETLTTAQKSVVLDPAEETVLTFKAYRTKENDDIVVPITVTVDSDGEDSSEDVFVVSEILFEDGQTETEFEVSFPDSKVGVTYSCTIECTSPKYVYLYSSKPTYLNFEVLREKWSPVAAIKGSDGKDGIALWRDDFLASAFSRYDNVEWEVEVYENESKPGYYRFRNVYGPKYPYNSYFAAYDTSRDYWTYIDATDPNKVYIPTFQATGVTYSATYGRFLLGSDVGYSLAYDEDVNEENYGTLVNGVIKFPVDALLSGFAGTGDVAYANSNGMFRVLLPGAVDTDYTFELSSGVCANAKTPVTFTLGTDVAKVSYKVYEGTVSSGDLPVVVAEIVADKDAPSVTESGVVDVTCEKTGKYTLVGVAFDGEGNKVAEATTTFGYVAAGEEEANATIVNAGLELTSRYEAAGYDKTNSVLFYIYGEDLVDLRLGLYESDDEDLENLNALVPDLESADADALEAANGVGYSDLFVNLDPVTSYTLVVYASNGYTSKIVTAEITTDGLPLQKLGTGDYTYTIAFINEDGSPYLDEDLELWFDPNKGDTYNISNWGSGVNFKFTFDPAKGDVVVPVQYTGLSSSPTEVWVGELKSLYSPSVSGYDTIPTSSYDAETHTFTFVLGYVFVVNGQIVQLYGSGEETFVTDVEFKTGETDTPTTQSVKAIKQVTAKDLSKFAGIETVPSLKAASFSVAGQRSREFNGTAEFSKNVKAVDSRLIVK